MKIWKFTLIIIRFQNSFDDSDFNRINENDLPRIFGCHDRLVDLIEQINEFYSPITVIFIARYFVMAIFGLFFIAKVLFWSWEKNLRLILMSTTYNLWSILGIIEIFIIMNACQTTQQQAFRTSFFVYELIQKQPKFFIQNEINFVRSKSFIIQVLHRKKSFSFSGIGLFNLDYSFIFSVK